MQSLYTPLNFIIQTLPVLYLIDIYRFMSFRGINYGRIGEDTSNLSLLSMSGNHQILNINYSAINNSTINKNDIIV